MSKQIVRCHCGGRLAKVRYGSSEGEKFVWRHIGNRFTKPNCKRPHPGVEAGELIPTVIGTEARVCADIAERQRDSALSQLEALQSTSPAKEGSEH